MIAKIKNKLNIVNYFSIAFFILFILVIVILTSVNFIKFNRQFSDKIFQNVFIDNLDVTGKRKKDIISYFNNKSLQLKPLEINITYQNQIIATFSGEMINLRFDGETVAERAYLIGRSKYTTSTIYQRLISFLKLNEFNFNSQIEYDDSLIKEFISNAKDKYDHPAKNALFKFENNKVTSFRKEVFGLEIQEETFISDIDNAIDKLKGHPNNQIVTLPAKKISPEITLASANNFGIEEEIAVGVSNYTHSIPERIHNVILASSKFNGILIPKNKIFSFNDTIGDISSYTGYKPAYIIKEGKTVLGDGGGVCQVSTTLFRAALNAGLPIVERHAHAYRVGYYENDSKPGLDATVFSPSVDLKIKNDTNAYILIETEVDEENNLLYFRLFGKKDNRRSEISNISLWDVSPPPPPKYQDDPTLKKAVTKQIDFPAWGAKASFDYKVYKDKKLTIDEKYYSYYKPWAAVFSVGTAD